MKKYIIIAGLLMISAGNYASAQVARPVQEDKVARREEKRESKGNRKLQASDRRKDRKAQKEENKEEKMEDKQHKYE